MTWDEWEQIVTLIENGWSAGEWDAKKSATYFNLLKDHDVHEVMKAVSIIMEEGSPFRPSAAQIIAAINAISDCYLPPWNMVWNGLQKALKMRSDREALIHLESTVHPLVRAFAETEGLDYLRMTPFFGDYGPIEIERLKKRWEEFADVAKQRVKVGRAVAAVTGSGEGPRQLDAVEAMGLKKPEQKQIGRAA